MLFWQLDRAAASRTFCTAGNSRPMRMAMIAITTSNSISVNADRRDERVTMIPPPKRIENDERWTRQPVRPGGTTMARLTFPRPATHRAAEGFGRPTPVVVGTGDGRAVTYTSDVRRRSCEVQS